MNKIYLVCTGEGDARFMQRWRANLHLNPEIKKGWRTWIYTHELPEFVAGAPIHPEDNKYGINFPPQMFRLARTRKSIGGALAAVLVCALIVLCIASLIYAMATGQVDASRW